MKRLAIKTPDNRLLFTDLKNLHHVLEYVKNVSAELYIANCKKQMSLKELTEAFCNNSIDQSSLEHNLVKAIYPVVAKKNKKTNALQSFINNKLIEQNNISVSDIKLQFPNANASTISYCLTKVIAELGKTGLKTKRTKRGYYEIIKK